jgi:hypothetical protein
VTDPPEELQGPARDGQAWPAPAWCRDHVGGPGAADCLGPRSGQIGGTGRRGHLSRARAASDQCPAPSDSCGPEGVVRARAAWPSASPGGNYPGQSGNRCRTQLADLGMATDMNRHPDLPRSERGLAARPGLLPDASCTPGGDNRTLALTPRNCSICLPRRRAPSAESGGRCLISSVLVVR